MPKVVTVISNLNYNQFACEEYISHIKKNK